MAENPVVNGLDELPPIKSEPIDPLLDVEPMPLEPVIPKEFLPSAANGLHEDSDCEDISFFTQVEVDNTRKCLENTRLIIKDFETQLDWHLQQYMTLRNIFNTKKSKNSKGGEDANKRQDLLSISQLSAIIANHPEGNKKFIKRKAPVSNGAGGRKRRRGRKESESEEESDFSDEESEEFDEDDFVEDDSEDADDPGTAAKGKAKKKPRGKRGKNADDMVVPKDEIEEEIHELVVPKEEKDSDEEPMEEEGEDFVETPPPEPKKTPARRGRKPKAVETPTEPKTPAKRGGRGKKAQKKVETIDLTDLKTCKVVLSRLQEDDSQDSLIEIKNEEIDKDDLMQLLQPKLVESIESLKIDPEKPIVILKDDNYKTFDYNECKTSNVIITFEHSEALPEFIFTKNVATQILNGFVKVVLASVFDQHLND